jgi:diguanylate cyclase (GGDEF)-like protein
MQLNTITFSIGIALYPEHGSTLDELFTTADSALYKVKENGRNNVLIAQQE